MVSIEDMSNEELEAELTKLEGDSSSTSYGSPSPAPKENQFKFFKELLSENDPLKVSKVSNLNTEELGRLSHSVRRYLDVAAYAEAEGLSTVSDYLENKAKIISATAMGKKGFFAQLCVTQIKKEQKITPKEPVNTSWFSRNVGGKQNATMD